MCFPFSYWSEGPWLLGDSRVRVCYFTHNTHHCSSPKSRHRTLWEEEEDKSRGDVLDFSGEDGALAVSCFAPYGGESVSCFREESRRSSSVPLCTVAASDMEEERKFLDGGPVSAVHE